jgi:hypothetical protein
MTGSTPSPNDDLLERLLGRYTGAEEDTVAARADAEAALEAIANEAPRETDSGGTRILIKNVHIQLGEVTEELVVSLAELGLSTADPTPISKLDAFRRLATFLWQIRKSIQKLDYDDRDVCRAVAAVTLAKKDKVLIEPGASQEEVLANFQRRNEMPPDDLPDRLTDLTERHVLERKKYEFSGPFYRVVF